MLIDPLTFKYLFMIEYLEPTLIFSIAPLVLAGIISGGASLLGSGIGAVTSSSQNKSNQNFSIEQMKLQQQYNERNMQLQDQYQRNLTRDTPSLNVQGLREAGLNPLLANGAGASLAFFCDSNLNLP